MQQFPTLLRFSILSRILFHASCSFSVLMSLNCFLPFSIFFLFVALFVSSISSDSVICKWSAIYKTSSRPRFWKLCMGITLFWPFHPEFPTLPFWVEGSKQCGAHTKYCKKRPTTFDTGRLDKKCLCSCKYLGICSLPPTNDWSGKIAACRGTIKPISVCMKTVPPYLTLLGPLIISSPEAFVVSIHYQEIERPDKNPYGGWMIDRLQAV